METKKCTKCGRELPIEEFYKSKNCKDGYKNICKKCVKQYNERYYIEHKEEYAEWGKQYRQANREALAERKKQYSQENRETISEYNKQYHKKNRDKILERQKQYYQTPNGRAVNLVNNYRRLDKEANRGECTLTPEWIIDNIFTQQCHWCKKTDWTKMGCDRIDNDKPHTPDNVIPCCEECNKKRGTRTYEEFLKLIKTPVTYV